jgi:calcium-dependent protein kinase
MKEMASHCVAHRDMKPENCLIKDNVFKIADYGFSTKLKSLDEPMTMQCGTPLYMSP